VKFELGAGVRCDLSKLIDTRALIQANSGGGKSHTLRRLLEQTHGHVQQLIVDPEGEFSSLRERGDYILSAKNGGDTAADPRAAKLLAERLLELGVSAILDIYELKAHERIRFVRAFLEALVDAPKTLWHPALVVVDEAHVFCPQQGEAESAPAVIDLCTRGRKRGFSAILATQRLSKLHKDAAAELNNKLIGRTGLDVDRKRAGEELGFTTKEQLLSLRQLEPGHFYAFGPALSLEVVQVQVGPVQTTHPKAGSRIAFTAPPPTDKVKKLLPQLADLPAEAEQKQRSEADLRKDLAAARATITRLERAPRIEPKTETKVERVAVPMLTEEHLAGLRAAAKAIQETFANARGVLEQMIQERGALTDALKQIDMAIARATKPVQSAAKPPSLMAKREVVFAKAVPARNDGIRSDLPKGEAAVLRAVAHYPEGCSRKQLTVLTGYRRSTRDTYLQRLSEKGLVQIAGTDLLATSAGLEALGPDFEPLPIGAELLEHWRRRLPEGERKILDIVVAAHPQPVSRDEISDSTGYARSSRDTYLQRLGAKRLVEADREGIKASDLLFDGAA
jgi:predicted transcriptional regulator